MAKNSGAKGINPKELVGSTKPPLHLVPPVANVHEAMVMKGGAKDYGPFNWRDQPVTFSTYISAIDRHLSAMMDGETFDRKSGLLHAAHIRANTGIIIDAWEQGTLVDDRPVAGKAGDAIERFTQTKGQPKPTFRGTSVSFLPQLSLPANVLSDLKGQTATEVRNQMHDLEDDAQQIADAPDGAVVPIGSGYAAAFDLANKQDGFSGAKTKQQKCRAYISGPMRGYEKYNFPAFDSARDRLNALGVGTFSPADMDRINGVDENWVSAGNKYEDVRTFARRDADALLSLRPEDGDFVLVLPGWEKSTGAKAEVLFALWLGLPLRTLDRIGVGTRYPVDFVVELELSADSLHTLVQSIAELVVKVHSDIAEYRSNIGRVDWF